MLKKLEVETASEEETMELGRAIGTVLKPRDTVLLTGDLGAGKTRLAKGIISAATGVEPDEVVSPTFTLINRFEGDFAVDHADLYRIEADQIDSIGLDEVLAETGALIVEWAEKLSDVDADSLRIYISYTQREDSRRIVLEWLEGGIWHQRIRSLHLERSAPRKCADATL